MKRWLVIILVSGLILGGIYYFVGPNEASVKNLSAPVGKAGSAATAKLAQIKDAQTKSVGQYVGDTSHNISQTVSNLLNSGRVAVRNKIAEALGFPPSSLQPPGVSQGTPVGGPDAANSGVEICMSLPTGTTVKYILENPFSPKQGFTYKVDWGDGLTLNGQMNADDTETVVDHAYAKSGSYPNIFTITGSSSDVTIQRKVCVK